MTAPAGVTAPGAGLLNQPPICEFEIGFQTDPAATRLPRHAGEPGIWKDEPGLGYDASLRGHCRIARLMQISACVGRVRVPLRPVVACTRDRLASGWSRRDRPGASTIVIVTLGAS